MNRWVRDQLDQLGTAIPTIPVEDRAADTWEPLVAVADAAGGHWPDTARNAVLVLTGAEPAEETVSLRVRLLMDCRTAFGDLKTLTAANLLARLKADDKAPCSDMNGGEGIKSRKLGLMLGQFHIYSVKRRWDIGQARVYDRADFVDSWTRCCPPEPAPPGMRPMRPIRPALGQNGTH